MRRRRPIDELECDCRIYMVGDDVTPEIDYCPTHEAAFEAQEQIRALWHATSCPRKYHFPRLFCQQCKDDEPIIEAVVSKMEGIDPD